MFEEFPIAEWNLATDSDWRHYTVCFSCFQDAGDEEVLKCLCRDRATYDPATSAYVVYTVASPTDAPASLTFGSSLMKLAATYAGTVVLGTFTFLPTLPSSGNMKSSTTDPLQDSTVAITTSQIPYLPPNLRKAAWEI
jgi:hypothetical protein